MNDNWKEGYRRLLPIYEVYASKLKALLLDLLDEADIEIVQVEARAKCLDSLERKVREKDGKYADPLSDVTDLCGLRVIAYYLEDVDRIGAIIDEAFEVDEVRSIKKAGELEPDRFGYLSDHFIITLRDSRAALPEWAQFALRPAEIQVRTVSQHAWAAIEHGLGYKSARALPRGLQRRLYRLSALFELADEQFSAVRAATAELEQTYADTVNSGDLSLPINAASLDAYVDSSPTVRSLIGDFETLGGRARMSSDSDHDAERLDLDRSDLFDALLSRGVSTLEVLDQQLQSPAARRHLGSYVEAENASASELDFYREDLITRLLFLLMPSTDEDLASFYSDPTFGILRSLQREGG